MGEEREDSRSLSPDGEERLREGARARAAPAGKSEGARAPGAGLAAQGTGHLQDCVMNLDFGPWTSPLLYARLT